MNLRLVKRVTAHPAAKYILLVQDNISTHAADSFKLVLSDGLKGIQKAVDKSFLGAPWQISLTEVIESFDEVKTCVAYISYVLFQGLVAKKYHKEIADEIKIALENESEMQQLRLDLQIRGYSKSAGPFCISNSAYGITYHSPEGH